MLGPPNNTQQSGMSMQQPTGGSLNPLGLPPHFHNPNMQQHQVKNSIC